MGYYKDIEFRWKIDTKETVAFILCNYESHHKIYMINSQEELDIVLRVMKNSHFQWKLKIFDENGNLVEEHKSDFTGLSFNDFEVKLDEVDTDYEDFTSLVKKLDAEFKHQKKLARRRELRKQKKEQKQGE